MKSNLMKRYAEKKRKEQAHEEAVRFVLEHNYEFLRRADISILYTLHTEFGFGAKRIEKFYKAMIKNHIYMVDHYQSKGDNTHYWVMEARLKRNGIDVKALQDWADKYGEESGENRRE